MIPYLDLLRKILEHGSLRGDRTGTGTRSLFGAQLRFDLSQGFPLATTRKVFFKGVIHELLWFLAGDTNIKYLAGHNVHIWDAWADENGDLGPVYGAQWRAWEAPDGSRIDQITNLVEQIRANPNPAGTSSARGILRCCLMKMSARRTMFEPGAPPLRHATPSSIFTSPMDASPASFTNEAPMLRSVWFSTSPNTPS